MSEKNNGGPAFPQAEYPNMNQTGMTLRDYFAAKAMQAIVTSTAYQEGNWGHALIAEQAYDIAVAMLKAREA